MKPVRFYLIVALIYLADQITKWAIMQSMPLNTSRPALGKLLSFTHIGNTGGAFSLFQSRNSTFILVASIAIVALLYAYHRHQQTNLLASAALAMALGGAIGNLTDRIRFGYVVDFFDVHFWPIFNIADSAISIGIVLLAFSFLRQSSSAASPVRHPDISQRPPA